MFWVNRLKCHNTAQGVCKNDMLVHVTRLNKTEGFYKGQLRAKNRHMSWQRKRTSVGPGDKYTSNSFGYLGSICNDKSIALIGTHVLYG